MICGAKDDFSRRQCVLEAGHAGPHNDVLPPSSSEPAPRPVPFYSRTMQLRIYRRWAHIDDVGVFVDGRVPVLQQAWSTADGGIEWRDVPTDLEP